MIELTRLGRQKLTLNSDLIKWVESSVDTVITLVNGEKVIVMESAAEIVEKVMNYRRALLRDLDLSSLSRQAALSARPGTEPLAEPGEGEETSG